MSEEYLVKTAKTIKEARGLVKEGFEYVCEMEDVEIFRKRKKRVQKRGGLLKWCGGRDLNPRRPTPEDLKSSPLS